MTMNAHFERCDGCRIRLRSFGAANTQHSVTWLLPCLHAFCTLCKTKCMQDPQHNRCVCLLCRTECVRESVIALPVSKDCVPRQCETAACPDKQVASMRCVNCDELLCDACGQAHRRVTATSAHSLQALSNACAAHVVCAHHNRSLLAFYCSCGTMLCKECVATQTHEGPSHVKNRIMQLAPASRVDEAKIISSTAREIAHIDCSLSMIEVRKKSLDECVGNLKKDVGNHVVQVCQAVMRRGNDLLRALDTVKHFKTMDYDKLRGELIWQKMRFERIDAYVAEIKDYEDPVALVMTKQFLENCIRVIKTKKVNNEGSLNGLQRPPQVQFKPNTDYVLGVLHQWGRVLADLHEPGTLKPVEVQPTPLTSTPLDVPQFNVNMIRNAACQYASAPSTSMVRPPQPLLQARAPSPTLRPGAYPMPLCAPEQLMMLHRQQQMRDAAMRRTLPQSRVVPAPVNDPRFLAFRQQMPNVPPSQAFRFPAPYCYRPVAPPTSSFDPRFGANQQFLMPNGPPVSYQSMQMNAVPTTSIEAPIPAVALMEAISNEQMLARSMSMAHHNAMLSSPRTNEPSVVTTGLPPHAIQRSTADEQRKKIICDEMDEARRRREAAQLVERTVAHTEAETIAASSSTDECVTTARRSIETAPESTPVSQTPGGEQRSSTQLSSSSTSNSTPPPKDPAPLRTPLKVTIRRTAPTTALVNDPEHIASTTGTSNETTEPREEESKWDDYCYVCQQGCDDKTGSLGCCALCPHVYHNYCHVPPIKQPMESLPDEWACSMCLPAKSLIEDTGLMGERERLLCSKVLLQCYENFFQAEPFSHPVPRTVPSYYVIIKQPMDMGTVARRLREKAKDPISNVTQFIQAMNLVFINCSTFNPPDDEVARAGRNVYNLYSRAVKQFLPCMKGLVWLYINKYSEGRNSLIVHKDMMDGVQQQMRPCSSDSGSEPHNKKARKEIKDELD